MKGQLVMFIMIFSTFFALLADAAQLRDVTVLDITPKSESFELRLRAKEGDSNSYFFVDLLRKDPDVLDKLAFVLNKKKYKGKYILELEIPSFSLTPNGSYYRSDYVKFSGNSKK